MIITLSFCILVLIAIVMRLLMKLRRQKEIFRSNIKSLQNCIAENATKQAKNQDRLLLVDEFDQSLKSIKANLYTSIVDLNYDLFELLSENNLLKTGKW